MFFRILLAVYVIAIITLAIADVGTATACSEKYTWNLPFTVAFFMFINMLLAAAAYKEHIEDKHTEDEGY